MTVKIVSAADAGYTAGDDVPVTTNFTINGVTGVITPIVAGTHTNTAGDVWEVTYTFQLNDDFEKNFRGVNFKGAMDDTEGSKKATVWKGFGEFTTDQFVTSATYAVGDVLRCTTAGHALGAGLFTNEAAGGVVNKVLAVVTSVLTASVHERSCWYYQHEVHRRCSDRCPNSIRSIPGAPVARCRRHRLCVRRRRNKNGITGRLIRDGCNKPLCEK